MGGSQVIRVCQKGAHEWENEWTKTESANDCSWNHAFVLREVIPANLERYGVYQPVAASKAASVDHSEYEEVACEIYCGEHPSYPDECSQQ